MIRSSQIWRHPVVRLAFTIAAVTGCAVSLAYGIGYRVNVSASFPLGVYRQDPDSPLVMFCPEGALSSESLMYRAGKGSCPDGGKPMLKQVVAREGDLVQFSRLGIILGGNTLPNTAPLPHDTAGRPLRHWPYGVYRVPAGKLVVVATHSDHSYDSRYYGPIEAKWVTERLRPVLTYGANP